MINSDIQHTFAVFWPDVINFSVMLLSTFVFGLLFGRRKFPNAATVRS